MILKLSNNYTRKFLMVQASDHITGATGATVTVTLSKGAGGSFAGNSGGSGAITEIANGVYQVALTGTDTNTLGDLWIHCTGTSPTCDPTDFCDQVQTNIFTDLTLTGGAVTILSNIKQNAALNGFTFVMTNSTTNAPQTGLTVTAQRSLGGAGFAPCANAVSELSNGVYIINLAAADLNAAVVMLRFTATGANDLDLQVITQP
jgi:hypothetical protein